MFLHSHVTPSLQSMLPSAASDDFERDLLARLRCANIISTECRSDESSDGFILINALNDFVLGSSRPWGTISPNDMYDTLASGISSGPSSRSVSPLPEEDNGGREREWAFRKAGNLKAWAV